MSGPPEKEGCQVGLPAVEAGRADGQEALLDTSVAPGSDTEDGGEGEQPSEVEGLLDGLQAELAYDARKTKPAIRRPPKELAPATWHSWSSRRESPEFQHPAELDYVRIQMSDEELSERIGWLTKYKSSGLSPLDQAVLREWSARAISLGDLYGRDRRPQTSDFLIERLRDLGIRSNVANLIVGTLELAIVRRRNGFRLSAPEARSLWGCAASTWWYAIKRLEVEGVVERVGTVKPNPKGGAPVHTDSNCYVPGQWLLEHVEAILGLFQGRDDERAKAAGEAHQELLQARKARRRATRAQTRDRNRQRLHALQPRVTTTDKVERVAEQLEARHRQLRDQAEQLESLERARAALRGAELRLGVRPAKVENRSSEECEELEQAAQEHVGRVNAGDVENKLELPSEIASALQLAGINQTEGSHRKTPTRPTKLPPRHSAPRRIPDPPLAAPTPSPTNQPNLTSTTTTNPNRDHLLAFEGEGPVVGAPTNGGQPTSTAARQRARTEAAPVSEEQLLDRWGAGTFDPAELRRWLARGGVGVEEPNQNTELAPNGLATQPPSPSLPFFDPEAS